MKTPKKQFGVVFKVPNADKTTTTLVCVRKEKAWDRNPLAIEDKRGNYRTLGPTQLQLVEVTHHNGKIDIRDIVRVGLTEEDKATDVLKSIQDGIFFEIAEKALRAVLAGAAEKEKHASAKPLVALDGTETGIMDSWLREKFDAQRDGKPIYDVDEIKEMLAMMVHQQVIDNLNEGVPLTPLNEDQKLARKLEIEATANAAKDRFKAFVAPMVKGDEYWFFRSDPASWAALAGREGYVIIRDNKVVASYATRMS